MAWGNSIKLMYTIYERIRKAMEDYDAAMDEAAGLK